MVLDWYVVLPQDTISRGFAFEYLFLCNIEKCSAYWLLLLWGWWVGILSNVYLARALDAAVKSE
jgi:hypothetical protein